MACKFVFDCLLGREEQRRGEERRGEKRRGEESKEEESKHYKHSYENCHYMHDPSFLVPRKARRSYKRLLEKLAETPIEVLRSFLRL